MWIINSLDLSSVPSDQGYMSDGLPVVGITRGGQGTSFRLMVTGLGYIDITDCGLQGSGSQPYLLFIASYAYWYSGPTASIAMTVTSSLQCAVIGDGNSLNVYFTPFPFFDPSDLDVVAEMAEAGLIPYPVLPADGRPYSAVAATAAAFFPFSASATEIGLTVYDWTTPDFFRMDVFNYYQYTMVAGEPLDGNDIVTAIWTTNWPPYVASDPNFMGSMMMTPATSEADVATQYQAVNVQLKADLDCLKRVIAAALQAMPRTTVLSIPALYSGQVDVSNLGTSAFATYFLEYPGNAGPPPAPMGEPLNQALAGFLSAGNVVTLKSFLSTTDTQNDAVNYSNGILLQITPNGGSVVWGQCAYVTPLSNEATKTEYLFGPNAQFLMGPSSQQTINGKTLTVIQMTAF